MMPILSTGLLLATTLAIPRPECGAPIVIPYIQPPGATLTLPPGEYGRVAVSPDVYVAIGDSVTEGYDGRAYPGAPYADWTQAPISSADGRNYPQCGLSSGFYHDHWQFASHHVELNDLLAAALGHPVFILNQGLAGMTSTSYLARMSAPGWTQAMAALRPKKWLIHLGNNDPVPGPSGLQAIVDALRAQGAQPSDIFLAVPIAPGWSSIIAGLVTVNGLSPGPDFSDFLAHPQWLSGQSVHPNETGHSEMARRWAYAITSPPPPAGFFDDFSRPDGGLGSNWNIVQGSYSLLSGQARNSNAIGHHQAMIVGVTGADQTATVHFASSGNNGGPEFGVILRYQSPGNHYLVSRKAGGASQVKIGKYVGGVYTTLGWVNVPNPSVNGWFTLTASVVRSTLTLTLDGTVKVIVNDWTYASGGVGLWVYSGGVSHRIEDITVTVNGN